MQSRVSVFVGLIEPQTALEARLEQVCRIARSLLGEEIRSGPCLLQLVRQLGSGFEEEGGAVLFPESD